MSDDLDAILTSDEVLTPSPGFAPSVMRDVRRTSDLAALTRFPWFLFAGGLIGGALCLYFGATLFLEDHLEELSLRGIAAWAETVSLSCWSYALFSTLVLVGSLLVVRFTIELTSE